MNECDKCTCQCANQKQKMKDTARNFRNPVLIMNQTTYEAVTGNEIEIDGIPVEITKEMMDRTYMVTGQYLEDL